MANHKVHTADKIGDMTILTTSVAVREEYVTMVLVGGDVWDMSVSQTVEAAQEEHKSFCMAAEMFQPVVDKVKSGEINTTDDLRRETDRTMMTVLPAPKGYVH